MCLISGANNTIISLSRGIIKNHNTDLYFQENIQQTTYTYPANHPNSLANIPANHLQNTSKPLAMYKNELFLNK